MNGLERWKRSYPFGDEHEDGRGGPKRTAPLQPDELQVNVDFINHPSFLTTVLGDNGANGYIPDLLGLEPPSSQTDRTTSAAIDGGIASSSASSWHHESLSCPASDFVNYSSDLSYPIYVDHFNDFGYSNSISDLNGYDHVNSHDEASQLHQAEEPPALLHHNYVCYGMIPEINFQILPYAETHGFKPAEQIELLGIVEDKKCNAVAPDGTPLFLMNSRAFKAFKDLDCGVEIWITAQSRREDLLKSIQHNQTKSKGPKTVRLNVNVYGTKERSDDVGHTLSKHGMFLQLPHHDSTGITHSNPHLIKFDNISESDLWLQQLQAVSSSNQTSAADWGVVLDDLPQHHTYREAIGTSYMRTSLFDHQVDAQNYMLRRETGQLEDDMKYWLLETNDCGAPIYRHIVTGEEAYDEQEEPQSGILADHMGLGKTLSTISLLAGSMDRADAFASSPSTVFLDRTIALKNTKATLVVVPSVLLLEEWEKEIIKHAQPGAMQVTRYHGANRAKHFSELQAYDIVLTTYGTVAKEYNRLYQRGREVLYFLKWFRIVLDEAHTIRSQRTRQFDAIISLQAQHHWCLTGTPVSNKIEDLGALLKFCRVPLLQDHACFRDHLSKVAKRSLAQACRVLRQTLSPICLRRTKALLNIPEPRMVEHNLEFSAAEMKQYRDLEDYFRNMINTSVSRRDKGDAYNAMFKAILQLRIFCNHGTFYQMPTSQEEEFDPDEALTFLEEKGEAFCARCFTAISHLNQSEDPSSGSIRSCGHVVCGTCVELASNRRQLGVQEVCPICEDRVPEKRLRQQQPTALYNLDMSDKTSAKMEQLLKDLLQSQHQEKSIVFSVWKKTLDIASELCRRHGIAHVRIDGCVPQRERTRAIETFSKKMSEDDSTSVLLMTLGTGALGLNLTAATRIHILEPQWNPAVEDQAIGRAIRIGQEKEATIIRYYIRNSVEQQIYSYQRRKRNLAAGGFGDAPKPTEMDTVSLKDTWMSRS